MKTFVRNESFGLFLTISLISLTTVYGLEVVDIPTSTTLHDGFYGFWNGMVDAPSGYVGCGMSARVSSSTEDDSGVNGLKLKVCSATD